MNLDKFGHHVHKRQRLSEYLETFNDTIIKSDTGQYDLKSSKLKGLLSPSEDDEAVNKAYVDKIVEELRNEIKTLNSNVKQYLKSLEIATSDRLNKTFYSKTEIDRLIKTKTNNNE